MCKSIPALYRCQSWSTRTGPKRVWCGHLHGRNITCCSL